MAPIYSISIWQGVLFNFDLGTFVALAYDPAYQIVVRDIDVSYNGPPGASFSLGPGGSIWPVASPLLFDGSTWQWQGRYVVAGDEGVFIAALGSSTASLAFNIQVSGFQLSRP